MAKIPTGVGPKLPQIVVLFGATGDLAHKKLLPGLFHLVSAGFIAKCRIIGVSLDTIDAEGFRALARDAVFKQHQHGPNKEAWPAFEATLDYVPIAAGPGALKEAVEKAEKSFVEETQLVNYLSVPPNAALSAIKMLSAADLAKGSRVIMEKPFGTDIESAIALNDALHKVFAEDQIFRIDHFLGKEPAQNILAFRFANGLFEPIWNRNFIDHVQIDVPETLDIGNRIAFYEQTGAYRDMVVTHLFQILGFMAMEPPTSLAPGPISEEKNKVFRSLTPVEPADVVRGQFIGYRKEAGVDPESDTETFIALKCFIDNWRWAGVPFFLRTGKRMAEGQRIISIAFREPPKSMFPGDSGISTQGPDHLTFDLADESKVSLSFYGKRPGPGMRLNKQSLQFAMHETGMGGDVLEAYERLILDAMRGDHTLFCSAEGIERLWEVSTPLLDSPAAGQDLRARQLGTASHLSADRAACVALAVRARLARPQSGWRLKEGCPRRIDVLDPADARPSSHPGAGDGRRRRADRTPQRTRVRPGPIRARRLPHPREDRRRSDLELRRPRRHAPGRRLGDDADRHRRRPGAAARAVDRRAGVPQPGDRRGAGQSLARGGEGGRLEARHPGRR